MNQDKYKTIKLSWFSQGKLNQDLLWKDIVTASTYAKGRLLDIGCGNMPYKKLFQQYVTSYIGLDPRTSTADIKGDFLQVPMKVKSFDTVLCTQVLEHVSEPDAFLKKINTVLTPGGTLILSVPLINPLHEIPYDYYRYTKFGLRHLLEKNGFAIEYIKEEGDWLISISYLVCCYLEGSYNRFLLRYPKQLLMACIQLSLYTLSKTLPKRFTKSDICPLNYLVVAKKK